jgi:hypothetical protein
MQRQIEKQRVGVKKSINKKERKKLTERVRNMQIQRDRVTEG